MKNKIRSREFTAPNGEKKTFWFRDGTNDESTIIACFEEDHYKVLDEGLKAGDIAIDLGAHIGAVTGILATIPGVKVVAVEALPENCGILKKNLLKDNVAVYEKAVWSASNRKVKVCYGDNSLSGKVHKFVGTIGKGVDQDSFKVETISLLDIFMKENIKTCRFLKTDIEGAEIEAIGKAPKHILKRIQKITGEYHGGDYHKLLKMTGDIFKDLTTRDMNSEVLANFYWRRNAG